MSARCSGLSISTTSESIINSISSKLNNIMACIPYPTFLNTPTSTPKIVNLSAVGRVRIFPLTCPGRLVVGNTSSSSSSSTGTTISATTTPSAPDEYCAIVEMLTTLPTTPPDDEKQQRFSSTRGTMFCETWSTFGLITPSRQSLLVHFADARSWPRWSCVKASWKLGQNPYTIVTIQLRQSTSPTHSGGFMITPSIILFERLFVSTMTFKALE